MPAEIAIAPPFQDDDIEQMDRLQLRAALSASLGFQADGLVRMARIVQRLEELGDDLSGLKIGLLHHLRRIACGQLLPEVVVQFAGKPSLIAIVGNLPLPEQRRIASGGTVRVLVIEGKETTHRMMLPAAMTPQQVRQAFSADHIRDDAEQAAILMRKRQESEGPRPKRIGELHPDYQRVGVVVGKTGKFIPLADLIAAVNALRK